MEYEEMAQDIVNVKVTSGDSKAEVKKTEMMKAEKNGNISTDIAAFQLERASFCSTRIINMDASRLFPVKTSPDISRRNEYDFQIGANPPPSPRSRKDLYEKKSYLEIKSFVSNINVSFFLILLSI